jgi:hypothetical protein
VPTVTISGVEKLQFSTSSWQFGPESRRRVEALEKMIDWKRTSDCIEIFISDENELTTVDFERSIFEQFMIEKPSQIEFTSKSRSFAMLRQL